MDAGSNPSGGRSGSILEAKKDGEGVPDWQGWSRPSGVI